MLGESAALSSTFAAVVPFRLNLATIGWMGQFNYPVIARLKPGVTLEQARADLNVIQQSVARIATKESHAAGRAARLDHAARRIDCRARAAGAAAAPRRDRRRRADRVREPREPVAHAGTGPACGTPRFAARSGPAAHGWSAASWSNSCCWRQPAERWDCWSRTQALNLFVTTAPIDLPRVNDVVIDGRVLGFAASVAIIAGLFVALLPAWRMGRGDVQATLRGGGHGTTDRGGLRVRATLLAVQVALSVTLLVVTGLFVTSFLQVLRVDPGFSPDRVLAVEIAPVASRYPDEQDTRRPLRSDPRGSTRSFRYFVGGVDVGAAADRRNVGRPDRESRRHATVFAEAERELPFHRA